MSAADLPVPGARLRRVSRWPREASGLGLSGGAQEGADWLADEVPVALVFNGVAHTVMMASPLDLGDFALGFGLSEGLLASPDELREVEVRVSEPPQPAGIELHLSVSPACEWRLKERKRTLAGRTGCGLCGAEGLQQVHRELPPVAPLQTTPAVLARAMAELHARQPLQQRTGATHAAAFCSAQGEALIVREDVGRHNALDKVIGALVRAGLSAQEGLLCLTSRASVEMAMKAVSAGVPILAAVSAPTALACDWAEAHNLALAGFVRGDRLVAYTFAERFNLEGL
ncbi:MAG: formate dehydrogenase accessory sulfurtransferase FdhD [Burkholderiales bacterium]|nr:formate dehydrogenase accessory sulfurtransferase FdhD [Burkholderiales bacterium]MBH2015356.1 formate dehydrogenase accessory sulfurtransferase FdhD [Burkholderiales bacterium]